MKRLLYALTVFPWLTSTGALAVDARVFTDTAGRKITAELQVVQDESVTVKRIDGKVFSIALDKLSEEDRDFCIDRGKKHADEMREMHDCGTELVQREKG